MADGLMRVTGIEDVCRFFDELPALVCQAALGKALRAGIDVVEGGVAANTPVSVEGEGEGTVIDKEHLVTALTTVVEVDSRGRGGVAKCGFGKLGHIARFVEFGHQLMTHIGNGHKVIGHVAPKPFMRQAFETTAEPAIAAFAESLAKDVNAGLGGRRD